MTKKNKTTETAATEVEAMDANAILIQELRNELENKNALLTREYAHLSELQSLIIQEREKAEQATERAEQASLELAKLPLAKILASCKSRGGQLLAKLGESERQRLTVSLKYATVKETTIAEMADKLTVKEQKTLAYIAKLENTARSLVTLWSEWGSKAKENASE